MTGYEQIFYDRLPKILNDISESLERMAETLDRLEKKMNEKSADEQK